MGLSKKLKYVLDHPGAVVDYFRLERQLSENRGRGVSNILFQCDAKGHFPYLKPYYEELQGAENVATYFTGSDLRGEVLPFLLQNGIPPGRIITYNSLVRLTDWDVYISLKVKGPAYIKGSTDRDGLWMDRVLLVRPPK